MAKRSKPVMRPEEGETRTYWPAKSRPPFSDADQPVDGHLDAEAGVVEAGPGLGADAGAEALAEGAGEVAGQRPLRRVGPEAGLVQADDAGGGQGGDLERVRRRPGG